MDDSDRCAATGVPADVGFATKPVPATPLITAALDAGVTARWVAGDEVYGADPTLRTTLEDRQSGYVLAIASNRRIAVGQGVRRVDELTADLPPWSWQRLSAGVGAHGLRMYAWAGADPRSVGVTDGFCCAATTPPVNSPTTTYKPHPVPLHTLVRVAG